MARKKSLWGNGELPASPRRLPGEFCFRPPLTKRLSPLQKVERTLTLEPWNMVSHTSNAGSPVHNGRSDDGHKGLVSHSPPLQTSILKLLLRSGSTSSRRRSRSRERERRKDRERDKDEDRSSSHHRSHKDSRSERDRDRDRPESDRRRHRSRSYERRREGDKERRDPERRERSHRDDRDREKDRDTRRRKRDESPEIDRPTDSKRRRDTEEDVVIPPPRPIEPMDVDHRSRRSSDATPISPDRRRERLPPPPEEPVRPMREDRDRDAPFDSRRPPGDYGNDRRRGSSDRNDRGPPRGGGDRFYPQASVLSSSM